MRYSIVLICFAINLATKNHYFVLQIPKTFPNALKPKLFEPSKERVITTECSNKIQLVQHAVHSHTHMRVDNIKAVIFSIVQLHITISTCLDECICSCCHEYSAAFYAH